MTLAEQLRVGAPGEHVLVCYRLKDTVITDAPVTRGLCETGDDGFLDRVVEHSVQRLADGSFEGVPARRAGRRRRFAT